VELSHRLQSLPPYHFAAYARKIAEKRADGVDVISLSMGDPDLPTPPEVLDALTAAAYDPINQRYPEYAGMPELRQAYAEWFRQRFGVALDPASEVLPLIGSKEGLAHLPAVVMNEGDIALLPNPNYPVAATAVAMIGGVVHELPLSEENGWLPDLNAIPEETLARARTLWLNYPNNPTGACAPLTFFEDAVRFAREHGLLLIHDMAYAEVRFDGARPPSVLQVEGAKDVAVELHSLSKAYNMAGFRIGALVGNATIVEGMTRLKSNIDTGIFKPIQIAAIRALALPPEWVEQRNAIYQRRRDRVVATCQRIGLRVATPEAGLYIWPHIPEGRASTEFAFDLLDHAGIAITPGTNFGSGGEGYVRISLTVPDARLDEAMARLEQNIAARA
jgi:LL-diaminopimelate aminotransferase